MKGMAVTIKHLFRRPITTQYPEERLVPSRRTRGNELIWDNAKCLVCTFCAKSCPQGAIHMVTGADPTGTKPVMTKIEVDTGYCISCGICVEACPYSALHMGYAYERSKYRREELVQANEGLLASDTRPVSAFMRPDFAEKLPKQTLLVDRPMGMFEKPKKEIPPPEPPKDEGTGEAATPADTVAPATPPAVASASAAPAAPAPAEPKPEAKAEDKVEIKTQHKKQ
jgi:formate hydrogenlyase subunit 6/NADH:ubiquinone oxidoreductase subunit I